MRLATSLEQLELFARSLGADDQVALEATGPANAIAGILAPHVGRVVVANTRRVRAIAEAKVKTGKVDARTLCELLDAGFVPTTCSPSSRSRRAGQTADERARREPGLGRQLGRRGR